MKLGQGLLPSSLAQISWVGRSNSSWAGSPKLETGEGAGSGARGGGGGRIRHADNGGRRGNGSREVPRRQEPILGQRRGVANRSSAHHGGTIGRRGITGEGPLEGLRPEFVWTPRCSGSRKSAEWRWSSRTDGLGQHARDGEGGADGAAR
jgi:hypothetical protein